MNRQDRAPGRNMRRAGPVWAVLATVGIALGAWMGIAPASDADEPKPSPASLTSVETGDTDPMPTAGRGRPTVDNLGPVAPRKVRVPAPGRAGVVTPGKPYVDRGIDPTAPGGERPNRHLGPERPKADQAGASWAARATTDDAPKEPGLPARTRDPAEPAKP
ncbi:hypothetical protein [Embleya scabrispora]|uniref:hypothetical protein n=1 Tax=Embleya scabrispora TaxID=159449 RepID=UPI000476AE0E|nr:hypothetical protein [Embleya scabrispora]MYS84189.1 hypothetical protein [Streptomyces sp. SID5474]